MCLKPGPFQNGWTARPDGTEIDNVRTKKKHFKVHRKLVFTKRWELGLVNSRVGGKRQ